MTKKKIIITVVISVLVVLTLCISLLGSLVYKTLCEQFSIPDFSDSGNPVYTPVGDHLPRKFHVTIFSIDEYMQWVYKLNKEEQKEVLADIEKGNWTLINENIYYGIKEFDSGYNASIILTKSLLEHECYVCVYDPNTEEIITEQDQYYYRRGHAQWVIYVYDTQTCKYYCIYETI